jgi:VIT1/CCC1 family predicted Fe2+/Mn2+ transporter
MNPRESWGEEMESAFIYREMAAVERVPEHRTLFGKLAVEAEKQAAIWAGGIRAAGHAAPTVFRPTLRARVVVALVRRLGARRMHAVLAAMKVRGMSVYTAGTLGHPMHRPVSEIGKRHRSPAGANLRAMVFGANDGLVSNASLILGVAGATGAAGESRAVIISGVAGLLAGAFSMASGEYVSVRSQREMFERQIDAERAELAEYPQAEAEELSLIYQARGLPQDDANRLAASIVANPAHALDTLAREELGLDPTSLGSPWGAATSSFLSFAVGALVPLAPFLLAGRHQPGAVGLRYAVALTAVALFAIGAATSLFTGRAAVRGGVRMLLIGGAAAAATFLIGRWLGVAVG